MPLAVIPLGNYLFWTGGAGNNDGQDPGYAVSFSSIATHPNGSVYTSEDTPNRGGKRAARTLGFQQGISDSGVNQVQDPLDVTASPYDGNIYFADHGAVKVNVWTSTGTFVRKWGVFNAAPTGGQIAELEAVLCDGVGNVITSDIGANRVNVYDTLGNYSRTIPSMSYFFPKIAAVSFDGTKVFTDSGAVLDSTSGSTVATLLDENGAGLVSIVTVYIPPGSAASNLWYFNNEGKIWRYNPATYALTGVYQVNLANQISPLGVTLGPFSPFAVWSVSTNEQLVYLDNWDTPYIYSFSVAGNRGGPNVPPRGRGAGW